MKPKILLTSFRTWLSHHKSNSSDDLLEVIQQQENELINLSFIRKLPVDIDLASQKVIKGIRTIKPNAVVCCGMAESRSRLTVESSAFFQEKFLKTSVDLKTLKDLLAITDISHDAGKFVCEGLYYQILKYTMRDEIDFIPCLFIHVPLLDKSNLELITKEFKLILEFLAQLPRSRTSI